MALAYSVVMVDAGLWAHNREEATRMAQKAADEKFEALAVEARKTLVTRNPEPRVMTFEEMANAFPELDYLTIVGLYFEADIS